MQTPDGAADQAAPLPLVARVAVLDHDGVYWPPLEERRPEAVKPGELVFGAPELKDVLPAGAVYVDLDCDLPGGKYKWDAAQRRFEPLPRDERKEAPSAPTLEQAFLDFCVKYGIHRLPARTAAWVKFMQGSLDERGRTKGGS